MALVGSSIPNLIGGVSQQAPSARAENATEAELNTYHSLVSGNQKRPPAEFVSEVYDTSEESKDGVAHGFRTADGKSWMLLIDSNAEATGRLAVVNVLTGETQEIDISGDNGYISGVQESYQKSFRFLSVGDTTFILNRGIAPTTVPLPEDVLLNEVATDYDVADFESLPDPQTMALGTTGKAGSNFYIVRRVGRFPSYFQDVLINEWFPWTPSTDRTRANPKRTASVYIRQAVHDTKYTFTITFDDDTTATATYTTPEAVDGGGNPVSINTGDIVSGLNAAFSSPDATSSVVGSTLSIAATKDIRKITFSDDFGDQATRAFSDSVQDFSDLPPNEIEGRIVRINGAIETGGDDYFVEFRDGIWKETVAYDKRSELDPTTMPMTLVYEPATGTFVLTEHEWPGRTCGDEVSNPDPSFVGRLINSMMLFKGRMVLLADENVLFSEVGFYENFYRTTLTQYLESDPIDVAATTSQTSILHHGASFDETLVVFSNRQQFRILSGDSLTPNNISIAPTTSFNVSVACAPVIAGANVLFAEDAEESKYASIREYYRNPNTEADDASDITSANPKYIPSGVVSIKSAANENLVVLQTANNSGELYAYKYFWSGGEKVISSWTKWKLSNCREIIAIDFFDDVLYAFVRDIEAQVHLVKIDVEEGKTDADSDYRTLLDMRVVGLNVVRSYDPAFDLTRYRLPMRVTGDDDIQVILRETFGEFPEGYEMKVVAVDGRFVFVEGNTVDVPVWLGFRYSQEIELSPIFIRRRTQSGEVVVQDNRLSLKYMTLYFDDTSSFRVEVTPQGRDTYKSFYTGRNFSEESSITDRLSIKDGFFRFACKGKAERTTIKIVNDTPFQAGFTSAVWEGDYTPRARRI